MKVAVTGSSGYIGAILTKRLLEKNCEVYGCDLSDAIPSLQLLNFWHGDYSDLHFIEWIVKSKVQTIFHLAATSLVGPSYTNPLSYYDNNTAKTIKFLNILKDYGWQGHVVFASTAAVYGNNLNRESFSESDALNPVNHYGQSKLFCEQILNSCRVYGISSTIFRFFNVVGSYRELGEESHDTHLLSRLCHSAITGEPFYLYGDDYPTRDGTCIRDYVHVVDVCEAQILAAEKLVGNTQTYNLGTNKGTSVYEMIDAFKKYTKQNINVQVTERRVGDPAILIANPRQFACSVGFDYNHSSVKEMIKSTWDYFNKRGG